MRVPASPGCSQRGPWAPPPASWQAGWLRPPRSQPLPPTWGPKEGRCRVQPGPRGLPRPLSGTPGSSLAAFPAGTVLTTTLAFPGGALPVHQTTSRSRKALTPEFPEASPQCGITPPTGTLPIFLRVGGRPIKRAGLRKGRRRGRGRRPLPQRGLAPNPSAGAPPHQRLPGSLQPEGRPSLKLHCVPAAERRVGRTPETPRPGAPVCPALATACPQGYRSPWP